MKYKYNDYSSLLIIDRNISKDIFLKNSGVGNDKYAEDMFSRIYDSIFSELINLEDDFEKYYKVEYPSLFKFIDIKFSISSKIIRKMFSIKSQRESYCIHYKKYEYSYGYGGIFELAFSERMYDRISNLLLIK